MRQQFNVEKYWEVIVYYDVDFDFLEPVYRELKSIGFTTKGILEVFKTLRMKKTKAVTCTNGYFHTSIVLFKPHDDILDYIDSLVHEAEHIKQAMLNTYLVEDEGEPPAYTIGYLVKRMWEVFRTIYNPDCSI